MKLVSWGMRTLEIIYFPLITLTHHSFSFPIILPISHSNSDTEDM